MKFNFSKRWTVFKSRVLYKRKLTPLDVLLRSGGADLTYGGGLILERWRQNNITEVERLLVKLTLRNYLLNLPT